MVGIRDEEPKRSAGGVSPVSLALLQVLLLFTVAALAAGCGEADTASSPEAADETVTLGYVDWEESVALSSLTKVLLEDLGYEDVRLRLMQPEAALRGVAEGDLDAFQSVWLPQHEELVEPVEEDVEVLNPWLIGTTRSSLAAPTYMGVRSLEELDGGLTLLGVEPGEAPVEVPAAFLSGSSLEPQLHPDTRAMLEEVDRLYEARRRFVFVAWSPHWMNVEYDFNYIEDPDGVLGELTQPARLQMVVRKDLVEQDPVVYALLDTIALAHFRVEHLELAIRDAGDPAEGARVWVEEHPNLVQSWMDRARAASAGEE